MSYIHGYSYREALRLNDQANTLEDIIHHDTLFGSGSLVLEAGCGVGAQTRIIASKNPDASFTSIDVSQDSLTQAQKLIESLDISNVTFQQADIYRLSFQDGTFDSIIVCFVLEHLHNPTEALSELKRGLKKGGTLVVIEGDHGTTFFHPDSTFAHRAIDCQVQLQKQSGGNSNIGRTLYPLLNISGFSYISVSPRMVYVDASKPQLVEGFIKNTFIAMIEGVGEKGIQHGFTDNIHFEKGIEDLYQTTGPYGVFSYTFFKALATKS